MIDFWTGWLGVLINMPMLLLLLTHLKLWRLPRNPSTFYGFLPVKTNFSPCNNPATILEDYYFFLESVVFVGQLSIKNTPGGSPFAVW